MRRWLLWASLAASARTAEAESLVRLHAEGSSCPSQSLVREQLEPLIGADRITTSPEPLAISARIHDAGAEYRIEVGGSARQVLDERRDCLERARVAAVFIALNLPETPRRKSQPPPPAPTAPSEVPERAIFGWTASISTELSPADGGLGIGGRLGPLVRSGPWFGAATLGLVSPVAASAEGALGERHSFDLTRWPLTVAAGWAWRQHRLELGPRLGAVFELWRVRGVGVPNAETAWRFNPGLTAGVVGRWWPSERLAAVIALDASAFFRRYELAVEPSPALARTPWLWLGAGVGIELFFDDVVEDRGGN